jgi:integrase
VTPEPLDESLAFRAFVRRKSGNVSEETLNRYWIYVAKFKEWLAGEHPTPANVDAYHEGVLMKKYVPNSRVPICSALNWWLRYRRIRDEEDEPLRLPIPETEAAEEPRTISDEEWSALRKHLERAGDLRELALVAVQRDTLLRPCDVVAIPLSLVVLDADHPHIAGKRQKKTGAFVKPFISKDTVGILRRYIAAYKPTRLLFETESGETFHRRWPLEVIRRACKRAGLPEDITSRVFRRTGATNWVGDVKDLAAQGGWKDVKTIWKHYRQVKEERHWGAFEETFEPAPDKPKVPDLEDPAFR